MFYEGIREEKFSTLATMIAFVGISGELNKEWEKWVCLILTDWNPFFIAKSVGKEKKVAVMPTPINEASVFRSLRNFQENLSLVVK